jgi:hypothetical protein
MEQYVLKKAYELQYSESNMNLIAKKLSNETDLMYGKSWTCFTVINVKFTGINFNSQENTIIWSHIEESILFFSNKR